MNQANQSTVQNAVTFLRKAPPTLTSSPTNAPFGISRTPNNVAGVGKKIGQRSTMGALGALLISLPAVASMHIPTNPLPLSEQATEQTRLGATVSRFTYERAVQRRIFAYLNTHPDAAALLSALPEIIDVIYGENTQKKVEIFVDQDTGEDIMRILFEPGIEDSDLLDTKEAELFHRIEKDGFGAGLFHVVLSQI